MPNMYPLLGRESELKLFRMLLTKGREQWTEETFVEGPLNDICHILILRLINQT